MPPTTLRELIESNVRLADATIGQTHAINREAAALERLVPQFEGLRHDISDIKDKLELDGAKLDLQIGRVGTDLALLLDNVKRAQGDVRDLQRDVTNSHLRLPAVPVDNRSAAEKMIDRFESMSTATKLWVLALVMVIVVGFGLHLILAAFGIGG